MTGKVFPIGSEPKNYNVIVVEVKGYNLGFRSPLTQSRVSVEYLVVMLFG